MTGILLSTGSLSFPSVNIGSSSSLPVTFTNNGNSNVTISNVSLSGAGYTVSGVQTGLILTPGQVASMSVTFTPATAGSLPGSVTVTSNASNSPAMVVLSGTGVQAVSHSVTLTWTASTSTVNGYNVYRSTVSGGPYREIATKLREIARECLLPRARQEILDLVARFERRAAARDRRNASAGSGQTKSG